MPQVIEAAINKILSNVHTAMPGTITKYDPATGLAEVQPGFTRKYSDAENSIPLPIIPGVPVVMPSTATAWIKLPVAVGDTVLLVFSERSIGSFMLKGGQLDPPELGKFRLKDAIAIPGLRPKPNAIKANGADDSLEVTYGTAYIEITKDGKFRIKNVVGELFTQIESLLTTLQSATVIDPISGPLPFSPAVIAQLVIIKTIITGMKA